MKTKFLIFIIISLCSSYILSAQGFNKAFDKFVAPHATWSIVELAGDNYILLGGGTDSAGFYGADILRIDHQGNIVWWKSYVAPGIKRYYAGAPSSMVLLGDSTLIAFGTVSYPNGEDNFCLYRFNLNGDTLYTKEWGNPGWEYGAFCRKSPDGNLLLGGITKTMGISKEDF
jgi:hypothetical protein